MGGRGRCRGSACCRSQHVKVYVPLGLTIQRDILAACHLGGRRIVGLHQPSRSRPRAIGHRRALAGFLTGRFTFCHHVAVVQSLCAPDTVYRYRGAGDFPEQGAGLQVSRGAKRFRARRRQSAAGSGRTPARGADNHFLGTHASGIVITGNPIMLR